MWSCLGDIVFEIYLPNSKDTKIGSVTKKWGGIIREEFLTNDDNFACEFPMDLPIKSKALIFASTFLIDYMYFLDQNKKKPQSNNTGGGGTSSTEIRAEQTAENELQKIRQSGLMGSIGI